MKIVHICLSGPYTDGFSYQENLLSKYHKLAGNEVALIASTQRYESDGSMVEVEPCEYTNIDEVHVVRLPYSRCGRIARKLRWVRGLGDVLEKEMPDIIFNHGVQSVCNEQVIAYVKRHSNVLLFCDNHCDECNAFSHGFYQQVIHKTLWRYEARKIAKYSRVVWGVLPSRVDFLTTVYGLPKEKCELLVMGADDELIETAEAYARSSKCKDRPVCKDDFVVITGGKIDSRKRQILDLMKAFKTDKLRGSALLVFGSVDTESRDEFEALLAESSNIIYLGWLDATSIYRCMELADLACFPGEHSVLWEQTAGMGKPLVLHYREGEQHISEKGNVRYLPSNSDSDNIAELLASIRDTSALEEMKDAAVLAQDKFRYSSISKRAIEY